MNRYTTSKLTDLDVKNAKPEAKLYRLRDGGGLSCDVMTTGRKVWRYAYRFADKQKTFTIGTYPDVGLKEARRRRNEARDKVNAGTDPSLEKQILKHTSNATSFRAIAEEWHQINKAGWAKSHSSRVISYLSRDAFPFIGDREISEITAPELIPVIKRVSDRGAVDAAGRVKGFIQQVFDYAVVHGKAERNPAKDINLGLILPKTVKRHFSAITDPLKVGELLRAIDGYHGMLSVKYALMVSPYVFLRPTELREAEWCEINLDKAVWTLPAARRKLATHLKKANRPEDALIIPLARQVVDILRNLHDYTGSGKYLFPSARGQSRALSNNALRVALRTMGFSNEDMTAHGFRGMASTCLNTLGYRSEVIETQLGHSEKNEIRAAYNHADYLAERTAMMQEWADYLDSLRSGADVVPFRNRA